LFNAEPYEDCADQGRSESTNLNDNVSLRDIYKYSIELLDLEESSRYTPFGDARILDIYVQIKDDYGKTLRGNLSYSIDQGNWTEIPFELIDGFPFNGSYFGRIWLERADKTVNYRLSFADELSAVSKK
jgi:hypothetical protein